MSSRSRRSAWRVSGLAVGMLALGVIAFGLASEVTLAESPAPSKIEKRSLDFSPRDAGQLFTVPQGTWSNLNRFVFLIGFDEYAPGATHLEFNTRLRQLSGFDELRAACLVWGNETFGRLQALATDLSRGDIKELLSRLQTALQRLRSGSRDAQNEFEQIANELNGKLIALSDLSGRVNKQLMTLHTLSTAAITEYKSRNFPESPWMSIGPKLDDVQYDIGLMVGRWNALTSDLNYLRSILVIEPGKAGIPELYDLDIEVGLTAWDKVAQDAKAFVANAPAQKKYLSGENFYEECPLNQQSWYVMKNQFLDQKGYVLTAQLPATQLQMKARNAEKEYQQEWQFLRQTKGWWTVVLRNNNPFVRGRYVLDGDNPSSVTVGTPTRSGQYGQLWRCLSTQNAGWFRLINAARGELYSLDTYNNSYGAFMGNLTKNYSGQYWRFEAGGSQ